MTGQDLRKEERFPASVLPQHLQFVRILFGGIDMSVENFVLGSSLVIYPKGDVKALYATVVYARPIHESTSRVGVQLKEVGQFLEYRKEFQQILSLARTTEKL
jgi:hypothetical protein